MVGAELLIVRDDETLVHEVVGWANRDAGVPLEKGAIYSIASLTKPVTALAVLMLVEDGVLSLDDRVTDHLENFGYLPIDPLPTTRICRRPGSPQRRRRGTRQGGVQRL